MDWAFDITVKNRNILKIFLDEIDLQSLNRVPNGFNNNIIWNIAHTIVTQQILVYRLSGLESLVTDELINMYKKGTKPERDVSKTEVDNIKKLLLCTIIKTKEDYKDGLFQNYQEYTVSTKSTLTNIEEAIEFNNFHEGLHLGYILALRRTI